MPEDIYGCPLKVELTSRCRPCRETDTDQYTVVQEPRIGKAHGMAAI